MDKRLKKLIKDMYILLPITPEDAARFVVSIYKGIDIRRNYRLHAHIMTQQELEEYILNNTTWGAFEKLRRQIEEIKSQILGEIFKFNFRG
jgi:hypothetical protein